MNWFVMRENRRMVLSVYAMARMLEESSIVEVMLTLREGILERG